MANKVYTVETTLSTGEKINSGMVVVPEGDPGVSVTGVSVIEDGEVLVPRKVVKDALIYEGAILSFSAIGATATAGTNLFNRVPDVDDVFCVVANAPLNEQIVGAWVNCKVTAIDDNQTTVQLLNVLTQAQGPKGDKGDSAFSLYKHDIRLTITGVSVILTITIYSTEDKPFTLSTLQAYIKSKGCTAANLEYSTWGYAMNFSQVNYVTALYASGSSLYARTYKYISDSPSYENAVVTAISDRVILC